MYHQNLDALLKHYVNEKGGVNYAGIKADNALEICISEMEAVDPSTLMEAEALAFWINAYNLYTIKLIVDNYPVGSIREISPFRIKGLKLAIPKINSPFEYKVATLAGKTYSLDDIEHKILRKQFDEPRIHFAIVCASSSCPQLRCEAYLADRLDEQLAHQTHLFLHDASKNQIPATSKLIRISKIFNWFKGDFTATAKSLQLFIAPYFEGEVRRNLEHNAYRVRYLDYDWSLNEV